MEVENVIPPSLLRLLCRETRWCYEKKQNMLWKRKDACGSGVITKLARCKINTVHFIFLLFQVLDIGKDLMVFLL
jgi:hypothetical protein